MNKFVKPKAVINPFRLLYLILASRLFVGVCLHIACRFSLILFTTSAIKQQANTLLSKERKAERNCQI